jgi:hypothetical protein
MAKTKFSVYRKNCEAAYTMSYICDCGEPSIAYGDDERGMFVGTCGNGHRVTVTAS